MCNTETAFFKAITALVQAENKYNGVSVVIDTDSIAIGICSSTEKDGITELWRYSGGKANGFFEEAAQRLSVEQNVLEQYFADNFDSVKRIYQTYYRCGNDGEIHIAGAITSCSVLEGVYETVCKTQLASALSEVEKHIPSSENGTVQYILVGRAATFFPIEYEVRRAFFPMPLVPIIPNLLIFGRGEASEALAERGVKLLEELDSKILRLEQDIMLQIMRYDGEKITPELVMLASGGTPFGMLDSSAMKHSVYVCCGDSLVIAANGRTYRIPVPAGVFERGASEAVVEVSMCLLNSIPTLVIDADDKETFIGIDPEIYGGKKK